MLYLTSAGEEVDDAVDLLRVVALAAALSVALALAILLRRLWLRRRGIPPIRFLSDHVELPLGATSRTVRRVRYGEILALSAVGAGPATRLLIDTARHSFIFPAAAFATPDGMQRAGQSLAAHLDTLPDRSEIRTRLQQRQEWGRRFLARPAPATRALVGLILALSIVQWVLLPAEISLAVLERGANVAELLWQGQWFRLVTANLLHVNWIHALSNAGFAWVIGQHVERQFGSGRLLILALATGPLSMLASAMAMSALQPFAYSIGASGALCGLLGAQAAFTWIHGARLPGLFRIPPRALGLLLLVNFVVLPLLIPQIDVAAHLGGLVAGFAVALVWCRADGGILERPTLSRFERALFGLLAVGWLAGLATAFGYGP